MNELETKVKEAIRNMVKTMLVESGISCTVVSVDKSAFTCDVKSVDREIDYFDVRLLASSGSSVTEGIITFPKVGSEVSIVLLDDTDNVAFVSKYSEIESYEVRIGAMSFYIDKDVIKLNGDSLGGLAKTEELASRISALETKHDSHMHPFTGSVAGAVCSGTTNPIAVPDFPVKTTQAVISNTKVKHG